MTRGRDSALVLGAVAYDPKVVTIWEGLCEYFRSVGMPVDFALFSNYERQVDSLLAGWIDIAWNTPLAHVRVKQHTGGRSLSLGMRDSDRDFHSRILVRTDAGIARLPDLEGKRLAVGSRDSTQARILPLYFLKQQGVELDRMHIVTFDSDVGKHGDTGASELDVLAALRNGDADAGAVGDLVWLMEQSAGRVDPRLIESLWTTPGFDHCMFDALPDMDSKKVADFQAALFAMQWDNPAHRRLLELEGLKQWLPPREGGYESLRLALVDQRLSDVTEVDPEG
jgi:phosphonate transport system substrate-binding protein